MDDPPLVGVLGAGGAVGGAVGGSVVREVAGLGGCRLRLGARRPEVLAGLAAGLARRMGSAGAVEAAGVDVTNPDSLHRFCAGCRVVVNCVGPLGGSRTAVAAAALAAGAGYVDSGGDETLREELASLTAPAVPGARRAGTAVVGAGVLPGLSGLVPRWLAAPALQPPTMLTAYVATLDRMTPSSAREFLLSVAGDSRANAAWRAGARVAGALEPLHRVRLPFFPGEVTAYPYLSAETERLARAAGLDEVRWYHVFDADGRVVATLGRLQQELRRGVDPAALAAELVRAVDVEMFGRAPTQQLVFGLDGRARGEPAGRVAVLRAASTYELTATVTALAAAEVIRGAVPAGAHLAAEVLDPAVVAGLPVRPGVSGLHRLDGPLAGYALAEQGVL